MTVCDVVFCFFRQGYTNHFQVMPCLDWNVKKMKSKREENSQISSNQDQNQMIHKVFLKGSSFNLHCNIL